MLCKIYIELNLITESLNFYLFLPSLVPPIVPAQLKPINVPFVSIQIYSSNLEINVLLALLTLKNVPNVLINLDALNVLPFSKKSPIPLELVKINVLPSQTTVKLSIPLNSEIP